MDDINTFYQIVDLDDSTYIDKEQFQHLFPQLSSTEINTIYNDFNKNHDNCICLKELMQSNNYLRKLYKQNAIDYECNTKETMTHTQINEIFNNLTCQEQIYEFYETLRNGSSDSTEQFQSILEVFVSDILKYRKEIKRLEDSYKREKETNANYLKHIEEEQDRDMHLLEERIRKEERQKFDLEREVLEQRTSKEINDLESNIQRLKTIDKLYTDRKNEEESSIILLHKEISKLTEENRVLNASLNDSLTINAILQTDLQSFKSQLNDRQTMLLQEKLSSSSNHKEKESLQTNVRHLIEVNKQLRDENDSLRVIVDSNKLNNLLIKNTTPTSKSSRSGSTLDVYWANSKLDSPSPSYITNVNQRKFDSFDVESNDEISTHGNVSQSIKTIDVNVSSQEILPVAASSTLSSSSIIDTKNTMNDSGLSLTTVRDGTEIESEHDLNLNQSSSSSKIPNQNRSLITKRNNNNNDDTDSDDVFVEISFDRNQSNRLPPYRSVKRNIRSSVEQSTTTPTLTANRSPLTKRTDKSIVTKYSNRLSNLNTQQDVPFDRMFKVVFCGDAAVGKTTLIMRLCKDKFVSNVNSTLGVDFQNKQVEVDGKRVAIQLWDTAGQERFRSIAKSYFRRCDGVILVYDATYERSFLNVREWIDTITDSTPKKVSVLIVANKIDLRDQMRKEGKRVIEHIEGAKLAKQYKALFIETSAKEGTNSNETLIELARDMQCNEDLERFRTAGIDLDKTAKKNICCGI